MAAIPVVPLPEKPIIGTSVASPGVSGESNNSYGVSGVCMGPPSAPAGPPERLGVPVAPVKMEGANVGPAYDGVYGVGKNGVHGQSVSDTDSGVFGENLGGGSGVSGSGKAGYGVVAAS